MELAIPDYDPAARRRPGLTFEDEPAGKPVTVQSATRYAVRVVLIAVDLGLLVMWSNGLFGLKRLDLGLRLLRGNLLVDPVDQRQEVEWSQVVDVAAAEIQPPGKQVQVLVPLRRQPVELPRWPSSPGTPSPGH